MRKRDLRDIRWLLADLNVAPNYTLDSVDEIVSSRHVRQLKGMILTLKLPDWKLASEIPKMVERVRAMGFRLVKTRQLAFNRQEFCLVAVRDRHALRASRQR